MLAELLRYNIKAKHYISVFLNAKLSLIHFIDFSCNIFNFGSMLIKQLIYPRKLKTENLKFRTDLQDRVMAVWSVIQ